MSYQTFVTKWNGQRVDTDGYPPPNPFQCVDEIKQYMHEEYDIPFGSYGSAIEYWTDTDPVILTKFNHAPDKEPKQGDIVVLTSPVSKDGHIGISTGINNQFGVEILEQNGATGNGLGKGGDVIRKNIVERSRIVGLLRPSQGENMKEDLVRYSIQAVTGNKFLPGYDYEKEVKYWIGRDQVEFGKYLYKLSDSYITAAYKALAAEAAPLAPGKYLVK